MVKHLTVKILDAKAYAYITVRTHDHVPSVHVYKRRETSCAYREQILHLIILADNVSVTTSFICCYQ